MGVIFASFHILDPGLNWFQWMQRMFKAKQSYNFRPSSLSLQICCSPSPCISLSLPICHSLSAFLSILLSLSCTQSVPHFLDTIKK